MSAPLVSKPPDRRPLIHATNAWNPIGKNLLPVPGCRLYYAHVTGLNGERTQVFLGNQQHLTFVADFEGYVSESDLYERIVGGQRISPHMVDLVSAAGSPPLLTHRADP
jgi:hypothetical protein